MQGKIPLAGCGLLLLIATGGGAEESQVGAAQPAIACEVTQPNGVVAGSKRRVPNSYGNSQLSLGPFGLWADGAVVFKPGGAGFITPDGSLGMKFGWTRARAGGGPLRIEGRRLDAPAPPLRSHVSNAGLFHPTYLVFSSPGCWEVTGHVGKASLTFVTKVVKIGDGPSWRRDILEGRRPTKE